MQNIKTFKTIYGKTYELVNITATKRGAESILKSYNKKGKIIPFKHKELRAYRNGRSIYHKEDAYTVYIIKD